MARLLLCRWVHRPLARHDVNARALVRLLLVVFVVLAGCESASDEPEAGTSREVADGIAGQLVSDGEIAYLSSTGLGSFLTTITALSPSGAPLWSVVAGGAMMIGEDGLLYSGGDGFISAIDRRGVRTAFDAPGLGSLSWHPWNVPMTWGQRGFLVLDRFGNTLIRRWEDVHVHAVAAAGDGTIFAIVTESDLTGTTATWLWKLTADLELVWWLAVEGSRGTPTGHHLALHRDEFVVFSSGGGTEARAFDGEFRWRIIPAVGGLVVDPSGTTHISSNRRTAVAADGTILWDEAGRVEMALTGNGLAATHVVTSRFGSPVPGLSLVNPSTGELSQTTLFPDSTDFLAPVVAGGRLVGASHRIDISQGTVGGDISVSQAAVSIVVAGPSAAAPVDGWPTATGPGGRGALPAREIQPSERDLIGLWVAARDGAGRAIRFTDQAPAFGLFGERIYGIWDGRLDDAPRLVQVGTWDLEQDQLQLTPVEDLVGAAGRTSLRIRPARPGVLAMDDPIENVARAFVRAARLPDATGLADAPRLEFIDESGARRAEFGRIVGVFPTDDGGAWAVGRYAGTGYFGTRQFRPSFVETDGRGNVTSTLDHMIVGRLSPSGEWTRYFHHEVDDGPQPFAVVPDGEGALLLGPMAVGARERRSVLGLRLAPTGENDLEAVEEIPWPTAPDDEGWTLESNISGVPFSDVLGVLPDGDIVLRAFRADTSQRSLLREHMRAVVFRAGRDGAVRWETPLPLRMDQAVLLGGTTNPGDGAVYLFGSAVAKVETPVGAVDVWGASRAFVARLNLDTGAWESLRGLGGGRPANDLLRGGVPAVPRAEGGFVLLETPAGLDVPFVTGTGRTVRRTMGTAHVLAAFNRELDSQWTTVIGSDVLDGQAAAPGQTRGRVMFSDLAALDDGSVAVGGYTMETFAVGDRVEGGGTRNAPVLAFSRCGGLLPIRWFRSRIELDTVTAYGDAVWAGGAYRSDIIEPPFTIGWPGRLATPSEPVGNENNLLMRLRMARITDDGAPCPAPEPGTIDLRVELRGTGTGRVVSSPPGIDCPGACVATFNELETITLTSLPDDGSQASGTRVTGGVLSRCEDDAVCELLATDHALAEVHFDSITVAWAHALPLRSNGWARGPWPVGDTVAVAGELVGPLTGAFGTWDLASQGNKVVVFVGRDGPRRVVPVPYAQDMIAVTPTGDVVAGIEVADMRRLDPDTTWTNRYTLVAVEDDGSLRWAHALPNPMSSTQVRVGVNGDRVGVTWLSRGTVTLGDFEVELTDATGDIAFATLDVASGEVLGLTPVGPRPAGFRANELGGFTLHGSLHAMAGFLGTAGPLPQEGPPLPAGRTGATLLRYGRDGAFVDATQWADERTVLRSSMGRDANQNPGAADVRIDGLLPAWVVHLGDITHFAPDGTALAANAPTINQWAALASYERYQAVLQRLTPDSRVTDAWVVASEDEVAVRGVTAWQGGAAALVAATRVRDATGETIVEDAEYIVVGLRYGRGGER